MLTAVPRSGERKGSSAVWAISGRFFCASRVNIYAYDAYVIACALNQRIPILTLDRALATRARELNVAVLEVSLP